MFSLFAAVFSFQGISQRRISAYPSAFCRFCIFILIPIPQAFFCRKIKNRISDSVQLLRLLCEACGTNSRFYCLVPNRPASCSLHFSLASCFVLMCCSSLRHSSFLFFCSFPSAPCLSALYLSALYLFALFLLCLAFLPFVLLSFIFLPFIFLSFIFLLFSFCVLPFCPLPFCSLSFRSLSFCSLSFYLPYCYLLIKFIFIIYLIFLLITTNPTLTFLSCFTCYPSGSSGQC